MSNDENKDKLKQSSASLEAPEQTRLDGRDATRKNLPIGIIIAGAVVLILAIVLFGRFCSSAATIHITVNGNEISMHGSKNMEAVIRASGLPINPGDLISLKGNILKRGDGYPFYATVNGEETADPQRTVGNGDVITLTDGKDRVEEYDAEEEPYPHDVRVTGQGTICSITAGTDGIIEHRRGRISGEERDKITQEPTNTTAVWHTPNVGSDKVIALTFEEGPSEYTSQVLDILKSNDAHATFFVVGQRAGNNPDTLKQAWFSYNQVCAATYDAKVSKNASAEELASQVHRCRQIISEIMGGAEVDRVVRLNNDLLKSSTIAAIDEEVDTVIGWDIDTADWLDNSEDTVYETLMSVQPGNIVVMRDGGNNADHTVTALKRALPELKAQGYSFITVSQLMNYPFA